MAKTITGIVASKKTDKTIVVVEHVRTTHPLYRKQYTVTKRFMAHDENNDAAKGDKVIITETRPISARKHFKLEKIVEKAGVRHTETEDAAVAVVTRKSKDSAKEEKAEKGTTK